MDSNALQKYMIKYAISRFCLKPYIIRMGKREIEIALMSNVNVRYFIALSETLKSFRKLFDKSIMYAMEVRNTATGSEELYKHCMLNIFSNASCYQTFRRISFVVKVLLRKRARRRLKGNGGFILDYKKFDFSTSNNHILRALLTAKK
uniref:Uncharacterized protein n=1 Tax=Glossina pallidipes TaxID=7398 RepID=A0A1A9ZVQ3_GLOPL